MGKFVVEVGVEVEVVVEVGVGVVVEVVFEVGVVSNNIKQEGTKMARMIEISDETYDKLKDQLVGDEKIDISGINDMLGKKFLFRTVTVYLVGKVKKVMGKILELETASWVADTGRFMNAIKEGKLNEVEPVGQAFINLDSVTDFFPWRFALPTEQK